MKTSERGFTIVEVLVAVLILTVGLLGLASSAAMVTRMIGQGGMYSESATLAVQQAEILRSQSQRCAGLLDGSRAEGRYTIEWDVGAATTTVSDAVEVHVFVTAPRAGQAARVDTFTTLIPCS